MLVSRYELLGILLVLIFVVSLQSAYAYQTIIVTPVEGSRLPGCQDAEIINGTVVREAGCYTPDNLQVKVGTLIIFKNTDLTAHSFTSDKFNSQLMINDGQEFTWVVEPGITTYTCLLHPWAVGSISGINAPAIDTFNPVPNWVNNLFNWYDDDIIDYNTFMNAIIYLMSYDIIQEYEEPEPDLVVEENNTTSTGGGKTGNQPIKKICERVLCD